MAKTPVDRETVNQLRDFIIKLLDDKKAEHIVTIDLNEKSSIADYLIIASGNSSRQVGAMAEALYRELKDQGMKPHMEGIPQCDWVLIDAGDVIVHLFRPEVRAFYNLEKMWGVDLPTPAVSA
jgi:ribosome-associated protein